MSIAKELDSCWVIAAMAFQVIGGLAPAFHIYQRLTHDRIAFPDRKRRASKALIAARRGALTSYII